MKQTARRAVALVASAAGLYVPIASAQTVTGAAPDTPAPTQAESPEHASEVSKPLDTWGTTKPVKEATVDTAAPKPSAAPEPVTDEEVESVRPESTPVLNEVDGDAGAHHLRYTLERVEIRGNYRTRSRVILRYLKFKPGDILDVDDPELTLTRFRVLGTGFFRDVQFSLHKGTRRGQVVLVVEVVERNTIVLNDVGMGVSSDADNNGNARPLTAYGGFDVAETNLAGTGMTLGVAMAFANEQNALRVRFFDPSFLGSPWMISGTLLRNQARDFFGTTSNVDWTDWNNNPYRAHYANVEYSRFGGTLGLGRDLSTSTQLWVYYRLETIDAKKPVAASEDRGEGSRSFLDEINIQPGRSVLSTIRATLQLDTRDHPFLPTGGWYVSTWGELALLPFGSDYDYQRFDISASKWWRVHRSGHVLRLQMFAGAETGNIPFFEQYYIGDFTDFRAPRMLGLNFERRPPPALFGGIIREQRYGEYAAKLGLEYRIPLYRGSRSFYGIDLFLSTGLWSLVRRSDLLKMPNNYTGAEQIPIDLTANVGLRMDTSAGGLTFAFSNILGFIPLRREGS